MMHACATIIANLIIEFKIVFQNVCIEKTLSSV